MAVERRGIAGKQDMFPVERRVRRNPHARCEGGESDPILSVRTTYSYFLGLKNLDVIKMAMFYVRKAYNQNVDVRVLRAANDPEVIKSIYASGDTEGVFQFEGAGITKAMMAFDPHTIEDVILMNAAYRPE